MTQHSPYDDIIGLPRPVSQTHPRMSLYDRAAQFMPFKALSGYEDDIDETARLTDEQVELDGDMIAQLDARLQYLGSHLAEAPEVTVTYFVPDARKDGGAYRTVTGTAKKLDAVSHTLVLRGGATIPIGAILDISVKQFPVTDEVASGINGDPCR